MSRRPGQRSGAYPWIAWLLPLLVGAMCGARPAYAAAPDSGPESLPGVLTLQTAVGWALQYNPEIAALRQQHGITAAGVIIAETYPFNPTLEAKVRYDTGPASAGVTNVLSQEYKLQLELEVRHQRRHREDAAGAALSRTDWEVAFQEVGLIVRTLRAYDTTLYRQEKLRLVEEIVRLSEETARHVAKLVEQAQLKPGDLILARTEVDDARAQLGPARTALTVALAELRRVLGVVACPLTLEGTLEPLLPSLDGPDLLTLALERRPDLRARTAAVSEADARLRLACADRYGNPAIGPVYELNETNVSFIGAQLNVPLPVLNTRTGEILQREAERTRAVLDLRSTEVLIGQELQAALARLAQAQLWAAGYQQQTLPRLRRALAEMEHLFANNEPGTDLLRVIDVRRKLLRARDTYLDALWEMSQARADLAAALGDPRLVLPACYNAAEEPGALKP